MSHTYEPFPWDSTKSGRAYTGSRYWDASDKMCAVRSEFVAGEGMRWVGFLYRVEGAVGKVGDARGEDWGGCMLFRVGVREVIRI